MSKSSRHHFIPKFYLENFVNPDNHFFVYDKQNPSNIFRKSPKQVCYETNRNSFFGKDNIPIPYLEAKTYSYFDNLHAPVFNKLLSNVIDNGYWTTENTHTIEFFIPFLFWRNPLNDILFDNFIDTLERLEDLNLVIFNGNTNEIINDISFHKKILKNSDFKKGARINASIETFRHKPERFKELEWRAFEVLDPSIFVTSDNPLLFRYSIKEFPIGPKRSFIRINEKSEEAYPHNAIQNFSIVHSAKRFVISSNKEYLELLINEYNRFLTNGNLYKILDSLWSF